MLQPNDDPSGSGFQKGFGFAESETKIPPRVRFTADISRGDLGKILGGCVALIGAIYGALQFYTKGVQWYDGVNGHFQIIEGQRVVSDGKIDTLRSDVTDLKNLVVLNQNDLRLELQEIKDRLSRQHADGHQ